MRLRPSHVLEGLHVEVDTNVDGVMDDFIHPLQASFYQIDETNIDDLDGDGVFGANDAFPFDAAESRDLDGDGWR